VERDVGCEPWPEVAFKTADDSRGPGSVRSPSGGGLGTRGMPRRLGSLREGGHAANVASKESEWWHRQKWTKVRDRRWTKVLLSGGPSRPSSLLRSDGANR
jgi:hypothetical protein